MYFLGTSSSSSSSESSEEEEPEEDTPKSPPVKLLTEQEMNQLGAKIVRAELMGDMVGLLFLLIRKIEAFFKSLYLIQHLKGKKSIVPSDV